MGPGIAANGQILCRSESRKHRKFLSVGRRKHETKEMVYHDYKRNFFSALQCAFALGGQFEPGNGATICAAHTDSPCLKVKPVSKIDKHGYCQVGVESYGGLLAHTWFDRDLSVAGRVVVDDGSGKYQSRLVKIPEPILRIPNLAIHLQNADERGAFKVNKEDHLAAVLSTAAYEELMKPEGGDTSQKEHHPSFIQRIAKELDVSAEHIRDFELHLFDTQAGTLGGLHKEFIFAPRLDNQVSCFASTKVSKAILCCFFIWLPLSA